MNCLFFLRQLAPNSPHLRPPLQASNSLLRPTLSTSIARSLIFLSDQNMWTNMKNMAVFHLAKAALLHLVLLNWPGNVANESRFTVSQFCQIVPGRNYCQNPKSPNSTNCVPLKIYDRDNTTLFTGPPCPKTCDKATLFMSKPDRCVSPPDNACVVYDLPKCESFCSDRTCSKRFFCWSQNVKACPSPDDKNLIVSKVYFVGDRSNSSSWIFIIIGAIALVAFIALLVFTYIYCRRRSSSTAYNSPLSTAFMHPPPNPSSIVSQTKADGQSRKSVTRSPSKSGFKSKTSRSAIKSPKTSAKPTKANAKTPEKGISRAPTP